MSSILRSNWCRGAVAIAIGWAVLSPMLSNAAEVIETDDSSDQTFYWTRQVLEPDSIASIWLLKRFVDPDCEIYYVPKGEALSGGIPFDMPLVPYSRTRTKSTFHVMREANAIDDLGVNELERLIDEIEIGGWNRERSIPASNLELALRACLEKGISPEEVTELGLIVLDAAYAEIGSVNN